MRSKFERKIAAQLRRNKIPYEYESETWTFPRPVPRAYCLCCGSTNIAKKSSYLIDFKVGDTYLETKGKLDANQRSKFISLQKEYPDRDIRFVFMRNNKIHKRSETRYTEWATKHGFKSAVGLVPRNWIKEFRN